MDLLYKSFLFFHIAVGSISLVLFWIPVIVKKGGKIHNKVGRIYVWSMWLVVITAAVLCIINLFRGRYISAGFLGFLVFLTGQPLWYAISVLKYKKALPDHMVRSRRIVNLILFFGGIGLVVWSLILQLQNMAMLLLIFGLLGVITSGEFLIQKKSKIQAEHNWLVEHLSGMIVTGIAGYTAFFAFGGGTFFGAIFSGQWMAIPWILPTVIGVYIMRRMKKKMGVA